MTETKPTPFQVAVGQQIRAAREYRGMTQDTFSGLLRRHGIGWNRSMLAKVERGERRVLLEELLLVAWATKLTVADFIPAEGTLELTPEATIDADAAGRLLKRTGDLTDFLVGQLDVPFHRALRERFGDHFLETSVYQLNPLLMEDLATAEEAERKMAARLGVEPAVVTAAARKLWGRDLSAWRDLKVASLSEPTMSDRSVQAIRGHVTRQLEKELAAYLEENQ